MTWKFENEAVPANVFPPRNLRKGPARSGNWVEVYQEQMDTTPKTVSTRHDYTQYYTKRCANALIILLSSRPIFI